MKRKHNVDEVIRSLSNKKGCVITLDKPIIKQVRETIFPDKERIQSKYTRYLDKNIETATSLLISLGEEDAHLTMFGEFKKKYPSLFQVRDITKDIVIQAPYVVNIHKARDLGNGSWGKIDFLLNHNGFSLQR